MLEVRLVLIAFMDLTFSEARFCNSVFKYTIDFTLSTEIPILCYAAKRSIYYGLVHSKIVYMNIIWGTATQARLKSLEVVQKNV